MTTYVALLRGINLGGRNRVGMDDLRRLLVGLGHADVRTYLQSGNAIFTSPDAEPSRVARAVEAGLAKDLGVTATVLLRSAEDLAGLVDGNPFVDREADPAKLHVTFLAEAPDPARAARLDAPPGQPDEFALGGREVYLLCPNGYGRTKLNNAFIEKRLGVAATTRNWRTVTKLRELAG